MWNDLTSELKSSKNIDSFKHKIKDILLTDLQSQDDTTTYSVENTKSACKNFFLFFGIMIFFKRSFFSEQISFYFITPPEGPLWKKGQIDLLNAIPAIFNLSVFELNF